MTLPNLVIAGAQRSGTTSLHTLLAAHPEVFFPARPQEIHYFDLEDNYRRGRAWYEAHFAGWQGQKIIGQTSPLYLFEPAAPGRCHGLLPEARVMVILRDPVARAWSHYWHEVRYGWEDRPFAEALEREAERLEGGEAARRHFSYAARGHYARQLDRWLEHYPKERLLVLLHEELKAAPEAALGRAAAFLDVDPAGFRLAGRKTHYNAARLPRFAPLQRWIRGPRERWPRLGYAVDRLNLVRRPYLPLPAETAARLARQFAGEAAALAERTGVDPRPWWNSAPWWN